VVAVKPRHVGVIAKKELRGLYTERTIVLAIALQIFIAMFSSFLLVGFTSMYDPASLSRYSSVQYAVAYSGTDTPLLDELEGDRSLAIYPMNLSEAVAALRERKLAAVIYVPDTPPDAEEPVTVTLYTVQNDLQATVVGIKIKEVLVEYEKTLRAARADRLDLRPIELQFAGSRRGGEFFEFVYGLLIPLLVFLPSIIASALVIDLITEEYQYGTLDVLVSSPISFSEVIWGKIAACELLVPLQAGAWLLLLAANGIRIQHMPEILLQVSAISFCMILLAALVALYYRERTDAQFIFSTALVVVMLGVLAVPSNPLNMLARLAVGTAGIEHWMVFGVVLASSLGLAAAVHLRTLSLGRDGRQQGWPARPPKA
jgi:ABC-type Na+ efflux pump permease subunit